MSHLCENRFSWEFEIRFFFYYIWTKHRRRCLWVNKYLYIYTESVCHNISVTVIIKDMHVNEYSILLFCFDWEIFISISDIDDVFFSGKRIVLLVKPRLCSLIRISVVVFFSSFDKKQWTMEKIEGNLLWVLCDQK